MHPLRRALGLALLSLTISGLVVACEGNVGGSADDAARGDAATTPSDSGAPRDAAMPDGGAPADASGDDAGEATGVPIFVAQGYVDRTTISCDDGRTWIADRATERDLDGDGAPDPFECFSGIDCDHDRGRAKGITYSHGWFVATWGWGMPGAVRRSRDGRTWDPVLEGHTFGGIAGADGPLVLGSPNVQRSIDDGATWTDPVDSGLTVYNVRRTGYAPHDGGRWILVGEDGGTVDVVVSADGGETFFHPTTLPATCGRGVQNEGGIGYVDGAIVIVGGDGVPCRSTDGGTTFEAGSSFGSVSSSVVVSTGAELMVWGEGNLYRSSDGAVWTSTPLSPSGVSIGAVERSPAGTFVAVNAGWDRWYDQQRFYRSTDGVAWEALPSGAYVGSHPIHQISWGLADASACP